MALPSTPGAIAMPATGGYPRCAVIGGDMAPSLRLNGAGRAQA
jgi:hypothetical protein